MIEYAEQSFKRHDFFIKKNSTNIQYFYSNKITFSFRVNHNYCF